MFCRRELVLLEKLVLRASLQSLAAMTTAIATVRVRAAAMEGNRCWKFRLTVEIVESLQVVSVDLD